MTSVEEVVGKIVASKVERQWGHVCDDVITLKTPPRLEFGDIAIECFNLARIVKTNPADIAKTLASLLTEDTAIIAKAVAMGPYVNLTLNAQFLFSAVVGTTLKKKAITGPAVMLEYLSPNTNKPLHLGHVRNGVLGVAVTNLLQWSGARVTTSCLINDRGIHICKSMLAWKLFGNGATPASTGKKGDHFVGEYYVLFAQKAKDDPSLEAQAQEMLARWEKGDPEIVALWKKMKTWVVDGFEETCNTLGFTFDVIYEESDTYRLGKDIIRKGLARGVFQKSDSGAVVYPLPEEEFGLNKDGSQKRVTLLRHDGTSVYITQDIGTAIKRAKDHNLDKSIYVVGDEQTYHFRVLFHILRALGYAWATQSYHLAYGMVLLPDGKMKSREGTVVDADDLVAEVVGYARAWVDEKWGKAIAPNEAARRAHVIGVGAIKFYLLNANPKNTIRFNPAASISFDGVTGPYCQYAYARAKSVLRKADGRVDMSSADISLLGDVLEERILAQQLVALPSCVETAAVAHDPSIVADAAYHVARALNQFYTSCPILAVESRLAAARLQLLTTAAESLKELLHLLGIGVLEEM